MVLLSVKFKNKQKGKIKKKVNYKIIIPYAYKDYFQDNPHIILENHSLPNSAYDDLVYVLQYQYETCVE